MGFLSNLRKSEKGGVHQDWNVLTTEKELEAAIQRSHDKPVLFFKHSISCGISAMVKTNVESDWDLKKEEIDVYYLDLINHRAISNKIAEILGVVHQSPQAILVKAGKAVYDSSHHSISVEAIRTALN